MQNVEGFLQKMGSNFLVAALVPALAFVLAMMLLFGPIAPPTVLARLNKTLSPINQPGLLLFLFAVLIGFTISRLNTFIYKVFEGYILIWRIPWIQRHHDNMAKRLRDQIWDKEKQVRRARARKAKNTNLAKLSDELYRLRSKYQIEFPLVEAHVLPTRFGNILRAAEVYSNDRYGIDGVVVWPRLAYVIPEEYFEKIEDSNNGLAFLVNCSLLTMLLALLCWAASTYQWLVLHLANAGQGALLYFIPIDPSITNIYQERAILYLALGIMLAIGSYLWYRATLPIVTEYGNLVRSAFDLFRFELLEQLRLAQPHNSRVENDIWKMVSEFMAIGEANAPLYFDYTTAATESGRGNSEASGRAYTASKAKRPSPSGARRSKR